MAYFNVSLLGLAILILLVILFFITLFLKKIKCGWFYLILVFVILLSGFIIQNRIAYMPFYNFNQEVCKIYPDIEQVKLDLVYKGQICRINVYVADDESAEMVECLFIELLKRVNNNPLSEYLRQSADSEYLIIQIHFMGAEYQRFNSKQYRRTEWFTKENKSVQMWENDDTHKVYFYSDYVE